MVIPVSESGSARNNSLEVDLGKEDETCTLEHSESLEFVSSVCASLRCIVWYWEEEAHSQAFISNKAKCIWAASSARRCLTTTSLVVLSNFSRPSANHGFYVLWGLAYNLPVNDEDKSLDVWLGLKTLCERGALLFPLIRALLQIPTSRLLNVVPP